MARDLAADVAASPEPESEPVPAPVVDLATRRARPRWVRITAVAAALALVVAVGAAMLSVFSSDGSGTTTVALAASDGRVAVTARLRDDGTGTIVRSSLPSAPAGHEYQLWAQPDSQPAMRSAGLLGADPDGRHIRLPTHTRRIAISVEPTGGSRAPTTAPVAVSGDLS
jgi:anti-sigma-K factor RskA